MARIPIAAIDKSARFISFVLPIALATVFGLVLGGCGSSKSNSGGSAGGGSESEIVLGHYASLTGSEATFGRSTDNGIQLAIDEINEAGGINGKKVRVITYDDKGEKPEAGTAVTRLVTKDGVVAVLGEVASSLSLVGAPVCQEYGIPMVSPSSTNPAVTKEGDMIFRVCFIDPFQGFVCAKFAREHEGLKAAKAAILFDQTQAYAVGLQDEFAKAFVQQGGEIVSTQTYQRGDPDFSAQLTSIRASEPDVIFIPGYYTDVGNIALQTRKLGITVPLLGGDGWDSEKLGQIAGESINGSFYSNHYSHQDPDPRVQDFIKKYTERFEGTPDGLAALGYDAARILCDAIGKAGSLKGADIAAELAKTKDFAGVTGKISIDCAAGRRQAGRNVGNEKRRADLRHDHPAVKRGARSGERGVRNGAVMEEDDKLFRFESLEVWQRTADVGFELGGLADGLDERRRYRYAEQLRSAALSISNNIAEGSGSNSKSEFRNFLNYARRSTFECASMLLMFRRQQLAPPDIVQMQLVQLNQVSRMITSLSRSLG